jgi:phosphopentomutase
LTALGLSEKCIRNISSRHRIYRVFEEYDVKLLDIQRFISGGDLLLLTVDHGNDPTAQSTDHTRENVPLLYASNSGKKNMNLGVRCSFADGVRTAEEIFGVGGAQSLVGQSFLEEVF